VGESAAAFSADDSSAESSPLTPFASDGAERERPDAHRLVSPEPAHVNATDPFETEVPSIARDQPRALFRGSCGAPPSLAGEFGAARAHRGSKTSTRPLAARCSRAPSRPRALVRLLQMNVLTSTTEDRSNIPNHRIRGWDDCHARSKVSFRAEDNRQSFSGSGVESTEPRHSPLRLLAPETLPQPRSLRAPPVANTVLFPVRSDVGRKRCSRRRRGLAGRAQRKGHVTPDFREEIRCSGARGAFCRWAVSRCETEAFPEKAS
jgi:hypothetical protein